MMQKFDLMRSLFEALRMMDILPEGYKAMELVEGNVASRVVSFLYELVLEIQRSALQTLNNSLISSRKDLSVMLSSWISSHVKDKGLKVWNITSSMTVRSTHVLMH